MTGAIIDEHLQKEQAVRREAQPAGTGYALAPAKSDENGEVTKPLDAALEYRESPAVDASSSVAAQNAGADTTSSIQIPKPLRTARVEPAAPSAKITKQRLGLPPNFVARAARYGRTILLLDNVYRLPSGAEYIPQRATGTLGSRHVYALLSRAQYVAGQRGSVYVRQDGRIFDYGFDSGNPLSDMFDTGYTIYDLERTGCYAPETTTASVQQGGSLIRKLSSGKYRLYSKKKDPKTGKRRNLGTFNTRKAAQKHERAVQFFKSR